MGLFSFKNKTNSGTVNWTNLTDNSQLTEIKEMSFRKPVLIFKHSTRCSISLMAKSRLEGSWDLSEEDISPFYLDLLSYRSISDSIANEFDIYHQSPQILLIKDGKCTYTTSHGGIGLDNLKKEL